MSPGSRPLGFYQALTRQGNVRLLNPKIDSYDIICRCRGVITISGTSGFEALFYGKPVLLLGRAFYESFQEGVIRAGGYESIAESLQRMKKGINFRPEDLDRFVIALHRRSYPGAYEHTIDQIHDPSNYIALAAGVTQEWNFRMSHERETISA